MAPRDTLPRLRSRPAPGTGRGNGCVCTCVDEVTITVQASLDLECSLIQTIITKEVVPDEDECVDEETVVDLILYCKHDIEGSQRCFQGHGAFEMLPVDGEELLTILYRNDREPPPGSIQVMVGSEESTIQRDGFEGEGYSRYLVPLDPEELNETDPFSAEYWRQLMDGGRIPIYVRGIGATPRISFRPYHRLHKLEYTFPQIGLWSSGERYYGATQTLERVTPGPPRLLQYTVDGKDLTSDASLRLMTGAYVLLQSLAAISQLIRASPKFGWYLEAGVTLLSGKVVAEWQWREHESGETFLWHKIAINAVLLGIKLELGIGLGSFGFEAQAYAQLKGEFPAELAYERRSPSEPGFRVAMPNKFTGSVGVRAAAGSLVTIDGYAETAVTLQLELYWSDGLAIEANEIKWEGVKVTLKGALGFGGFGFELVHDVVLVEPRVLSKHSIPPKEPYRPPQITLDRITDIVESELTRWFDIRVFDEADNLIPPRQVAQRIALRYDARTDLRQDNSSVEGFAQDCRHRLEKLGERDYAREYVDDPKFQSFMSEDLERILDKYIDPIKEICIG